MPESWHLKTAHPDLSDLTRWVAEARYPEDMQEATNADVSEAVEQARAIWTSVSTELAQHGFSSGERPMIRWKSGLQPRLFSVLSHHFNDMSEDMKNYGKRSDVL